MKDLGHSGLRLWLDQWVSDSVRFGRRRAEEITFRLRDSVHSDQRAISSYLWIAYRLLIGCSVATADLIHGFRGVGRTTPAPQQTVPAIRFSHDGG